MSKQSDSLWWKKPLRIIQPNLQVKDTHLIDPQRLADQMVEMGANTMVFNVGGIYAWYPTQVANHTVNEYLPTDKDLLKEVIEACHANDVRFIARFDFSKAEDSIYQRHPQWFTRDAEGQPHILGAHRPGEWSLLMNTCINSSYRTTEVGIPVLEEVLDNYDIDGIFFNNPQYLTCFCDGCKRKYRAYYGEELPLDRKQFHPEWASRSMKDNIDQLHQTIKNNNPDVPTILYYNLHNDNLYDRAATADLLCTESQNVLSLGQKSIPQTALPSLSTKLGRSLPDYPNPLGIVHSSPGMDWRHTGMPPAEYSFWLCQVPANGGQIWHSLTGVPDTITDKRIIRIVTEHNMMVQKVEAYMDGAESASETAIIWDAAKSAEAWADGLLESQIPYDVLLPIQAEEGQLSSYRTVIIPEDVEWSASFLQAITSYADAGGNVIVEGVPNLDDDGVTNLLGIEAETFNSEYLVASYLRFEGINNPLQQKMEDVELIPMRGHVQYCKPTDNTEMLASLVPPFSPLESVGAPPERASISVTHTELPLITKHAYGKGQVMMFTFSLSQLLKEYKLGEHYQLLRNAVQHVSGGLSVEMKHTPGLLVSTFKKDQGQIIHFVNSAGRRPLTETLPLHDIELKIKVSDANSVHEVKALISGQELQWEIVGPYVQIKLPKLEQWEAIWVK